jgi:hypothetical protein
MRKADTADYRPTGRRRGVPAISTSTVQLALWWVMATALAIYPLRDLSLPLVGPVAAVAAGAAAAPAVLLARRPPDRNRPDCWPMRARF